MVTKKSVPLTEANRVENQPVDIDVIPEPVHPTKSTKVINYVIVAALIVVALSLGVMFKWASASDTVLTVKNSPFPVRTIREHPTADGVVILSVDLCKNTSDVGKTRTSFVSKTREVFLPIQEERLPKGCLNTEVPVVIPKNIEPDTYKIKFRVTYDINPLKKGIVNEFETKEFTVDPTPQ